MEAAELHAREGKVLRYVVTNRTPPTKPEKCINEIEWSDLPKTLLQARAALEKLRANGLVERDDQRGYTATAEGRQLNADATAQGMWQAPPIPIKEPYKSKSKGSRIVATYLFVQGLDPVELADDESFNKARSRGNQSLTGTNSRAEKESDDKRRNRPMDKLTFKTAVGGRISINPEKFIGVGSDVLRDEFSSDGAEAEAEE